MVVSISLYSQYMRSNSRRMMSSSQPELHSETLSQIIIITNYYIIIIIIIINKTVNVLCTTIKYVKHTQ